MKTKLVALALLPLVSCAVIAVEDESEMRSDHSLGHDRDHHERSIEWIDFGEDPMANPEFMSALMALGTPGPAHAELAKGVGEFDVSGQMWTAPEVSMPMIGTAQTEMILGGRYLVQHYQSDFMGMPFEGMMIMGFDNLSNEYWNIWIDTFSTGPTMAHGEELKGGDVQMHGMMRDPMTPNGRPYRSMMTVGDDGDFTMSMYDTLPDGSEYQTMELTYKKR
ncbi:MAG: DUF1579 family protein [Planctomycetota bacterium]